VDPSEALIGPISITAGVHPTDLRPVSFLIVHDEERGDVSLVLGDADDMTTLLSTFIKTQNLMREIQHLQAEREATTVEESMEILTEVVERYSITE
jgi:hypothetical protein